jgi:hypothetical protein
MQNYVTNLVHKNSFKFKVTWPFICFAHHQEQYTLHIIAEYKVSTLVKQLIRLMHSTLHVLIKVFTTILCKVYSCVFKPHDHLSQLNSWWAVPALSVNRPAVCEPIVENVIT